MITVGARVHPHPMNPETAVDRLRAAATVGGQAYLDELNTAAVALCQRPGDWQRVRAALDYAIRQDKP